MSIEKQGKSKNQTQHLSPLIECWCRVQLAVPQLFKSNEFIVSFCSTPGSALPLHFCILDVGVHPIGNQKIPMLAIQNASKKAAAWMARDENKYVRFKRLRCLI